MPLHENEVAFFNNWLRFDLVDTYQFNFKNKKCICWNFTSCPVAVCHMRGYICFDFSTRFAEETYVKDSFS